MFFFEIYPDLQTIKLEAQPSTFYSYYHSSKGGRLHEALPVVTGAHDDETNLNFG
jgi:hypothetical protein